MIPRMATPHLAADAGAKLKSVVTKASAATVEANVRKAFPEKYITVDTDAPTGMVIAAIGVPENQDCIVAVRDAKGTRIVEGFNREWLQPGETGCSTRLITNPPL
jgi:hypothetical protein